MTHYQNDKYENFMANLRAPRAVLAAFADFTVTAIGAVGVEATIAAQGAGLAKALARLRTGLVARTADGGSSQTGTSTEQTAFEEFKAFITDANTRHLRPYFLDHPGAETTFYPGKLAGLTQAPKSKRLDRLTAYTEALEAAPKPPATEPDAPGFLPVALAPKARRLLAAYITAAATKTKSRTALADTLAAQGPDFDELAEALWDVHTAALFAHRRDPMQARKYFDYASLPGGVSPKAGTTAAGPEA